MSRTPGLGLRTPPMVANSQRVMLTASGAQAEEIARPRGCTAAERTSEITTPVESKTLCQKWDEAGFRERQRGDSNEIAAGRIDDPLEVKRRVERLVYGDDEDAHYV